MTVKYNFNGCPLYTSEEDQFLIDHFPSMSARSMAAQMQRPLESVRARIVRLREKGRITGVAFRSSTRPPRIQVTPCTRTSGAIQAEHEAVAEEVKRLLLNRVTHGHLQPEEAITLALRLRQHLNKKGSAKLINMPVTRIVEMLEAA